MSALRARAPAISVVLPTRNRAHLLHRPIRSVLSQDFWNFELVVVDDGSSDGTKQRVASFADPRIVYVQLDAHGGGNVARNRGVRASRGAVVCFLDDDDAFLPDKLSFVARFFADHPDTDVLVDSFELRFPPEAGRLARLRINPNLPDSASVARATAIRRLYKPTGSFSARREALFAAGLFDETLLRRQDMDLLLRLARTARCASTDQLLWVKWETPGSISHRRDTLVRAVIDICIRHPDCYRRGDYRSGISRDLARQLLRLAAARDWAGLRADIRRIVAHWGPVAALRLVLRGLFEMGRREVTRKG